MINSPKLSYMRDDAVELVEFLPSSLQKTLFVVSSKTLVVVPFRASSHQSIQNKFIISKLKAIKIHILIERKPRSRSFIFAVARSSGLCRTAEYPAVNSKMIRGGRSYVSSPPAFSNDVKRLLVCTSNTVSIFSTSTGLQVL